jgi:Fe-S cluster assembly iron-binding protein IscA
MIHISKEAIQALKEKYNLNEGNKNVRIFIKGIG